MKERITKSRGNVFIDLDFPPEDPAVLAMCAVLMAKLRTLIDARGEAGVVYLAPGFVRLDAAQ